LKSDRTGSRVIRPNGDMTEPDTWTPKKEEANRTHFTPKKEKWFEGKVRELGEAIDALPDDRADLAAELLEAFDGDRG